MSLQAPIFLLGLAALPVLWWLHRRRRRHPPIDVPSLLFLEDELESKPPKRRFFDLDVVLAGLGAALLVLAAAGPALVHAAPGRSLRVIVSGGAPLGAPRIEANVERVLDVIRDGVGPTDRLQVVVAPPTREATTERRPADDALIQLALAGPGAWRAVLSDRPPPSDLDRRVEWIGVGDPGLRNAGIVRVRPDRIDGRRMLWVLLRAKPPQEVGLELRQGTARAVRRVEVNGFRSVELPIPGRGPIQLRRLGAPDDLASDDQVRIASPRLTVRIDLPEAHGRIVRAALRAAPDRFDEVQEGADLRVTARDGPVPDGAWRLVLRLAGETALFAPEGSDQRLPDPLVRDLSTRGVELAYAERPVGGGDPWLLWREGDWPVVSRKGRVVTFWPDPIAGRPSPAEAPLWPLFFDNLRRAVVGDDGAQGLLDADSSVLGAEVRDPATLPALLDDVPPDLPEKRRSLSLLLAGIGLLGWLGLWLRPRGTTS